MAVTGIAGPGGGSEKTPVGTVHLALAGDSGVTHRRVVLPGDRALVREIAVKCALDLIRRALGRKDDAASGEERRARPFPDQDSNLE